MLTNPFAMRKLLHTGIAVITALFLITGCKDSTSSSDENPPQFPPESSMEMNFSEFEEQGQSKQSVETQTIQNFTAAVATASVLKFIVDVNLAIPRAIFAAASASDAEFNGEGQWEWTYSQSAGGNTYEVRLVAEVQADESVNWSFYVTNSQLQIEDRLFFSGTTAGDGSQGSWTYYNLQTTQQEEVSTISWTVNGENDVDLRLDVLSDRFNNIDDYIDYSFDGTYKNAVYYDASDDATTELEINVETKAGFIISPGYNSGQKSCWDDQYQDTTCPSET